MFIYKSKGIFIFTSNNCSTYKCANIKPNTVINRTECCNDNQGDGFFFLLFVRSNKSDSFDDEISVNYFLKKCHTLYMYISTQRYAFLRHTFPKC